MQKTATYRQVKRQFGWILAVCIFLLGGFGQLQAQQQGALKKGNEAFEKMAYVDAIKYFEKALSKGFDKNGLIRLADAYRLTNNSRKAAEVYSKVVNLNQILPINYYYFAQALMNQGMYPEAAKWFDRYAKAAPQDPRGAKFANSCRTIQSYFADTSEIRLRSFPHNSKVDDFSPVWYKGGILFSSSRSEGSMVESRYDWNGQPYLDLYYSKMTGQGEKFSRPVLIKGKLNTRFHEATCAWDSLNSLVYFTRNNFFEGKKTTDENGIMNLKLFYADVPNSGPWSNVRSLPFNSDVYSVGHPAIQFGSETLLFISDMPGGFGGTDIYRVDFKEDGWATPVNLGPKVNSPGNEMFPYLTPDEILYFSSDGLGGLGGLDVFQCDLRASECIPQNMGAPINSSADDFGILMSGDHAWGMFSSNRGGGIGSDDMYLFEYQKPTWEGIVVDAVTKQPISGVKIALHLPRINRQVSGETDPDGKLNLMLNRDVTYQLVAEVPQYRAKRMEISTYGASKDDHLQDTIFMERPSIIVVTKVIDMTSGFPIANAKVRIVGTDMTMKTDSAGEVTFYYDPYPEYEQRPVDCPEQADAQYCFKFQDEGVLDFDTLQLTYEWSFGDGTKVRELEPRHCYRGPGTYHVELNLLDRSGKLFMNQATYDLEVRPPAGLLIDGPDTVKVGSRVTYASGRAILDGCSLDSFEWDFSSGEKYTGLGISHTFLRPGRYKLRLNASGTGAQAPEACSSCLTKDIVVMNADWIPFDRDSLMTAWSQKPTTPSPKIECEPQQPESYCYNFFDEGGLASDSMPFVYLWDLGDGTKMQGLTVNHCYAEPGTYNVRLEIMDPYTNRIVSLVSDYNLDVRDLRQVYVEGFDTVSIGTPVEFDAFKSDVPGCKISAVFWDFGDGMTASGAVATHSFSRKGTFRVKMIVQGTGEDGQPCSKCTYKEVQVLPDYRGNEMRDSLRTTAEVAINARRIPAGTVLLEVMKEGYANHRLSFDPGKEPGVVRDSLYMEKPGTEGSVAVDVTDESTKIRLKNVTLTLRDASTGIEVGTYELEEGAMTLPLEPNRTYSIVASKPGYLNSVQDIGPVQKGKKIMQVHLELKPAVVGSSWVLHNLYYDFDRANIRHDAAIELEKLAGFLKANPSLTIELGSHTDVRGSDPYNLELSQNRAISAVEYLKTRGISSNRILPRGYGEQKLTNRCEDGIACSEAQHQENRRTEITILGLKDPIYSQARKVEDIWGTISLTVPSTPKFSGPFTILVGTYVKEKDPAFFANLAGKFAVTGDKVDGFWEYKTGSYPDYATAKADLPAVISAGFTHASILATPIYNLNATAALDAEPKADPVVDAPVNQGGEVFYSVQVAVAGRTLQPSFVESFGTYKANLFEKQIEGRRVFFVGKYKTEQEAIKHLSKIQRTGHSDAFLVHFDKGKKSNITKIGSN